MPYKSTTQTRWELVIETRKDVHLQQSCMYDQFTDYTQACGRFDDGLIEKLESNLEKFDFPYQKYLITTWV
jgi:hypothetical protein